MNDSDPISRRAVFQRLKRLQGGGAPVRARADRQRPTLREGKDATLRRHDRVTRRLLLLGAGQIALFGLLAAKLTHLQKIEGRKYRSLAEENRLALRFRPSRRGRILDRDHNVVAANEDNLRVLVVADETPDLAASLTALAGVVDIADSDRRRVLSLAGRRNPQLPILVRDGLTWGDFARINVLGPQLPGIQTDVGWKRRYPAGEEMAHVVGYLGQPDRLQLASDPALRHTDARLGVAGIEQGFDKALRGRAGREEIEVDARGRHVRSLARSEPQPGSDLLLTVDLALQRQVRLRLAPFRCASAVAIDVRNGDLLAMVSTPGFDPNRLTDPLDQKEWQALAGADDQPMHDRATRGQYPPGSTFKMVTALAGLAAGVIDQRTHFDCSGGIERAGQKYRCWNRSGHGRTDLFRALKQSCDVFFYETADRVGIRRLAEMGHLLGLGQSYECGLPGQKAGLVPDPDWKLQEQRRGWLDGETLIAGIGQGYVLTTPLQLAVMTARLATGRKVEPRLVQPAAGMATAEPAPLPLQASHLNLVRRAMTGAVNEADGTAVKAALGLPGVLMAGKTGTAQVRSSQQRAPGQQLPWEQRDHALFVAFAPADAPRYALSVVIEHGERGGAVAGPVAADIMKLLLQRIPELRLSGLVGAVPVSPAIAASGEAAHD